MVGHTQNVVRHLLHKLPIARPLPPVWRLPLLLLERYYLAASSSCNGGRWLSVWTSQLHFPSASAVLYLSGRVLLSTKLPMTFGEYRHDSLPWWSRVTVPASGAKPLQGSSRATPRCWVGNKLLGDSALLIHWRVLHDISLGGIFLDRETNVRKQCLMKSFKFVCSKRQILRIRLR